MITGNYDKHFKNLGKIAKSWDRAVAVLAVDATTLTDRQTEDAALYDQVATADPDDLVATELIASYQQALSATRTAGSSARKSLMETMAAAYLTSPYFYGDLTNVPEAPSSAKSVLEALIEEMTDDSKTLTTASSTGFVHFFETVWAPTGSLSAGSRR
jgi:hypothetical protein